MKTYEVEISYPIQVDAESKEDAIDKAETQFCQDVLADNPTSEVFLLDCKEIIYSEKYCEECGNENIVWFTLNEIWNKVKIDKIVCPICFVKKAESIGINKNAWKLIPEFYEEKGK